MPALQASIPGQGCFAANLCSVRGQRHTGAGVPPTDQQMRERRQMTDSKAPVNAHKAYHAHVYFDAGSAERARALCQQAGEVFGLAVGHFHEALVGPHPCWSCQITFGTRDFDRFVPWLDAQRGDLTILIHGLTGDDVRDHTDYAYWLGTPVPLNLSFFAAR